MRAIVIIVLFYLSLIMTACSIGTVKLYPGPDLSIKELAIVNVSMSGMVIQRLDGKDVKIGAVMNGKENGAISPGNHTLGVKYSIYSNNIFVGDFDVDLELYLQADHKYYLAIKDFYYRDMESEKCKEFPMGTYMVVTGDDPKNKEYAGGFCKLFLPYIYDRDLDKVITMNLKYGNNIIVIDDSLKELKKIVAN